MRDKLKLAYEIAAFITGVGILTFAIINYPLIVAAVFASAMFLILLIGLF